MHQPSDRLGALGAGENQPGKLSKTPRGSVALGTPVAVGHLVADQLARVVPRRDLKLPHE